MIALVNLHFVNFDNFLTFRNRKILQVKHNSGWNFKSLQTHQMQTVSVTSKTVHTNANTLLNVSTLRCQSGRLAAGGENQLECWNSKTLCSFAGEETPMHTLNSSPLDRNLLARRRSKHPPYFFCLDKGRKCGNLQCAHLVNCMDYFTILSQRIWRVSENWQERIFITCITIITLHKLRAENSSGDFFLYCVWTVYSL